MSTSGAGGEQGDQKGATVGGAEDAGVVQASDGESFIAELGKAMEVACKREHDVGDIWEGGIDKRMRAQPSVRESALVRAERETGSE